MSVLSRIHAIPAQRGARRVRDLDAPAPVGVAPPPSRDGHRPALLIGGAAAALVAGVGTAGYLLVDEGASSGAPSTSVDVPFTSEAKRDAAAAARHRTSTTEAKRDAAAAVRNLMR